MFKNGMFWVGVFKSGVFLGRFGEFREGFGGFGGLGGFEEFRDVLKGFGRF